jgi:hypothetical protein
MAITAADYNNIRNKVVGVLGTGAGGYGQTPVSSAATATNVISSTLWNGLRTDMIKSRQHQTGEDESANLPILTRTTAITEAIRAQFDNYANIIVANRKEIGLTGSIPQGQNESFATSSTWSSVWNSTLYHKVVVTFASALQANYWFNAGGQFRFYAGKVGTPTNSKDIEWSSIIGNSSTKNGDASSGFGKVYMNYGTISTLPGTAFSAGTAFPAFSFYNNSPNWNTTNLPTTATTIFFKQFTGYGALNRYQIQMYVNNATAPTAFTFLITFQDNAGLTPPWGIDDDVTGQLTSYVDILRPTVSGGVTLNAPTRTTNTGLTNVAQT